MREDNRNKNWFVVESKSFEISTEGEGRKVKIFITERSKGLSSWIQFGEEGMRNLLKGVEVSCRDPSLIRRAFEWKEIGGTYRLDQRVNDVKRYLRCFSTDVEGKRHRLFFLDA